MNLAPFSDADRQHFETIKGELLRLLPRSQPQSEVIFRCAQIFGEIRERGYYALEDAGDCPIWMERLFQIGPHQAQKYFHIATLPPEEVTGKARGVEVLYQIALCPIALRRTLGALADGEQLSGGALAAGRLAALPHLRTGQPERACKELVKAARRQVKKEMEQRERRRTQQAPPAQQMARDLSRGRLRLQDLLARGLVRALDVAGIRTEIARLVTLDDELAALPDKDVQPPAEETDLQRTSETSGCAEGEGSQGIAGPAAEPLPERMEPYRALVDALRGSIHEEQAVALRESLGRIIRGSPRSPELSTVRSLLADRITPADGALLMQGLAQLDTRDPVMRGRFALEWLVAARPPGYGTKLTVLSMLNLPAELHEQVVHWRDRAAGQAGNWA